MKLRVNKYMNDVIKSPVLGDVNIIEKTYVSGSMAKPNVNRTMNIRPSSLNVDHVSNRYADDAITRRNAVTVNVKKSQRNDAIQNVNIFIPLSNCNNFALQFRSYS